MNQIELTREGVVLSKRFFAYGNKNINIGIQIDKRVRKTTERWKFSNRIASHVVIMNLLVCSDKSRLYYSRDKKRMLPKQYNRYKLTNFKIAKAMDELESYGMVENNIAQRQYGSVTDKQASYAVVTDLFIKTFSKRSTLISDAVDVYVSSFNPIELRDKDKHPIEFETNELIEEAKRVVSGINALNLTHKITDYNGDSIVCMYTRVFNNSSFDIGGRWFKATILAIKNKLTNNRLRTKIDDKQVVEIDFDCLHIAMLSDMLGITKYRGIDIYYHVLDKKDYTANNRRLVKLAINIMLNATSLQKATQAINDEMRGGKYCYKNASEVIAAVHKALPEFVQKFCTKECTGLVLQNKDSWIAHYVVDEFLKVNKPVLIIHDSFIAIKEDAQFLSDCMTMAYKKVMQVDRVVHMKMNWLEDGLPQSVDCSK